MSKKSLERQLQKKKQQKQISRRKLLKNCLIGGGVLLSGAGAFLIYEKIGNPTFVEAYDNPKLRQKWLNGLESRSYVSKKIARDEHLAELKRKLNYTPPKGAFAATIALDEDKIGRGSPSELYVYESCFDKTLERFKTGLGKVVENVIVHHELTHADHYYAGIPGFPMEWFYNSNGKINVPLFMDVTETVCYRSEYDGLESMKHNDEFTKTYQLLLKKVAIPHFLAIQGLTGNKELIRRAMLKRWFLFSN